MITTSKGKIPRLRSRCSNTSHARNTPVWSLCTRAIRISMTCEEELQPTFAVHAHRNHFFRPEDLELWEGMEDWVPTPSEATLDALLRGDRKTWCADTDLRGELEARNVPKNKRSKMIEAAIESFVGTTYKTDAADPGTLPRLQMSALDAPRLWVHTDNLFVVFVQKTEDNSTQGRMVFDALSEALQNWNPPYLPTVLAYARAVVARGGFRSETITLSDPLLQAGWLFHSVSGTEDERADRLRGLFERAVEPLRQRHAGRYRGIR